MDKSVFKNYIAQGKTQEVFEALKAEGIDSSEALLLEGRYNRNEKSNRQGLLSTSDYNLERARINAALLDIIDDLKVSGAGGGRGVVSPPPEVIPSPENKLPPSKKLRILFFGSNPFGTGKLNLEKEYHKIAKRLEDEAVQAKLQLKSELNTSLDDFQEKISDYQPNIIHFAGHGKDGDSPGDTGYRDAGLEENWKDTSGLVFTESEGSKAVVVTTDVLDYNFETFKAENIPIDVVIFNACYSENQAQVIAKRVKYVVGVNNTIPDEASIDFSAGFYYGLASGKEVKSAFRYGKGRALPKLRDRDHIVLYEDGVKVGL